MKCYVDTSLYDLKWTHENTNTNTRTTPPATAANSSSKKCYNIRFRLEFLVFNRRDLSYVYIARKICYMHKRDIVFWVTTIEERRSGVAFMYQPSYFMCTRARRVTGVVFGHAILSHSSTRVNIELFSQTGDKDSIWIHSIDIQGVVLWNFQMTLCVFGCMVVGYMCFRFG